jgi:hypothetical protein
MMKSTTVAQEPERRRVEARQAVSGQPRRRILPLGALAILTAFG